MHWDSLIFGKKNFDKRLLVFKISNRTKSMNSYFWLRTLMREKKNRSEDGLRKYGCYFNSISLCGVSLAVHI